MLGINDQKDLSERRLRRLIESHIDEEDTVARVANKADWFELVSFSAFAFKGAS